MKSVHEIIEIIDSYINMHSMMLNGNDVVVITLKTIKKRILEDTENDQKRK